MARAAFVDAPAGCAGDMFLGALVDLGLPVAVLEEMIEGMGLDDVELKTQTVRRGAFAATHVQVCRGGEPIEGRADRHLHGDTETAHGHRTLADIRAIIARLGDSTQGPLAQARRAFEALADAEARVHGAQQETVHFHEVGAADALVDIVGTCIGFDHLGVEEIRVSPLPWGRGTVGSAHGRLPLPAPATVLLMEGHPTVPSRETHEEVTPTGAALVRVLASGSEVPAGFVPRRTGCGAGSSDTSALPNILRVVVGDVEPAGAGGDAVHLATNLDDVSGQVAARAMERALAEGALDAWWAPITMKKGRPGVVLSVLARPVDVARLEALLFRETPTLGIRRRSVQRTVLARRHEAVETPWGSVRVKVRNAPDGPECTPEYEDCRRLADARGVPLRRVLDAAARAWTPGTE